MVNNENKLKKVFFNTKQFLRWKKLKNKVNSTDNKYEKFLLLLLSHDKLIQQSNAE